MTTLLMKNNCGFPDNFRASFFNIFDKDDGFLTSCGFTLTFLLIINIWVFLFQETFFLRKETVRRDYGSFKIREYIKLS